MPFEMKGCEKSHHCSSQNNYNVFCLGTNPANNCESHFTAVKKKKSFKQTETVRIVW